MHERHGIGLRPPSPPAEKGIRDAMLETPAEPGLTDDWQHVIDPTTVRGHSQATALKGDLLAGNL